MSWLARLSVQRLTVFVLGSPVSVCHVFMFMNVVNCNLKFKSLFSSCFHKQPCDSGIVVVGIDKHKLKGRGEEKKEGIIFGCYFTLVTQLLVSFPCHAPHCAIVTFWWVTNKVQGQVRSQNENWCQLQGVVYVFSQVFLTGDHDYVIHSQKLQILFNPHLPRLSSNHYWGKTWWRKMACTSFHNMLYGSLLYPPLIIDPKTQFTIHRLLSLYWTVSKILGRMGSIIWMLWNILCHAKKRHSTRKSKVQ